MERLIHLTYEENPNQGTNECESYISLKMRCEKEGGSEKQICLCCCMSQCHCEPLVGCDCSSDWCNDRSSWDRKGAEGGRVWSRVFAGL